MSIEKPYIATEDEVDDVCDKLGSYDDAFRALGISSPNEIHYTATPEIFEDGPALRIDARAIALEGIMKYLNQHYRTKGSRSQLTLKNSAFRNRYADPEEVQQAAEQKTRSLRPAFTKGIDILAGGPDLRASDMDDELVERETLATQADINKEFGESSNSRMRAKAVKTAKRTQANI